MLVGSRIPRKEKSCDQTLEAMSVSVAANLATKVIEKVSQRLGEHIKPSNVEKFIAPTEEILRKLSSLLYNGKASKARINYRTVPYFFYSMSIFPHYLYPKIPCDCIYDALSSLVERWEEEKSSHTTKANSFS
jgi:hypothetical protein